MSITKILVFGDVAGKFNSFFKRLESINQKNGPFDIVFCVGDFFGNGDQNIELTKYKNNRKAFLPIPVFVLGPIALEQVKFYENLADGEICHNLTYLGKRGLYTLSSGIKIAYLSGLDESTCSDTDGSKSFCFSKDDVNAVKNSCLSTKNYNSDYRGIDILLTSQWPCGVDDHNLQHSSKLISQLCREIRPRYHFCGLNKKFLESPPFRIDKDNITQLSLSSRFIGLADFGNAAKNKYVFAVSLTPVSRISITELIGGTTDEVPCPYENIDSNACDFSESRPQYFYEMVSDVRDDRKRSFREENHGNKRLKFTPIEQEKCWFCLSSPDVEKHLVISIGARFYLALAKGPINEYHVLILSIRHVQSSAHLTDDDWEELIKFKDALRNFFKDQGYAVCYTERNYKASHLQIDTLGINVGYAWKIEHAFEDKAEEYNLEVVHLPSLTGPDMFPQGPYFVAEMPDGKTLLTRQMKHFPIHFARDVFCCENLLNCEEKVDWKQCILSKDEEIHMVENFRKKFEKYDFTIK